jgi:hypothetical protein
VPSPKSPGSRATCLRSDRRFPLNQEIATRDFNGSTPYLVNRQSSNPDGRWFLISFACLGNKSRASSPRSNDLQIFVNWFCDPRPLILLDGFKSSILFILRNLSWICSHCDEEELSLLRLISLTPSETFHTRFTCSTSNSSQSVEVIQTLCNPANNSPVFLLPDSSLRLQIRPALQLHGLNNPMQLLGESRMRA